MGDMFLSIGAVCVIVLLFYLFVRVIAWIVGWKPLANGRETTIGDNKREPGVTNYSFRMKKCIMTESEKKFFKRLESICANKYYIFPQMHLSSILDEKIKGQNWANAFKYTNNWSVDYVLCNKKTLETVWAIELDDPTHKRPDRAERDKQKDEILALAGVPLIRFSDIDDLSNRDIIEKFVKVKSNYCR